MLETLEETNQYIYLEHYILVGDLNLVLTREEIRGNSAPRDPYKETLKTLILEWDLLYVNTMNKEYTWMKNNTCPSKSLVLTSFLFIKFF